MLYEPGAALESRVNKVEESVKLHNNIATHIQTLIVK